MSSVFLAWAATRSVPVSASNAASAATPVSQAIVLMCHLSRMSASLFRRQRPDFGLGLCIVQIAQLGAGAARDLRRLVSRLEAREVRPVAPSEWAAQLLACLDCRIVHDVDRALVVRLA